MAAPAELLATARNEFDPAWSPAGDQFAFVTDRTGTLGIWARSRDGQWERPIVTDATSTLRVGDVGVVRLFARRPHPRVSAAERSAHSKIWLSPSTGGTPVQLIGNDDRSGLTRTHRAGRLTANGLCTDARSRVVHIDEEFEWARTSSSNLKVDVLPCHLGRTGHPTASGSVSRPLRASSRVSSQRRRPQTLTTGIPLWRSPGRPTAGTSSRWERATGRPSRAHGNRFGDARRQGRQPDLGPIPVASDPIRGFRSPRVRDSSPRLRTRAPISGCWRDFNSRAGG